MPAALHGESDSSYLVAAYPPPFAILQTGASSANRELGRGHRSHALAANVVPGERTHLSAIAGSIRIAGSTDSNQNVGTAWPASLRIATRERQ